MKTERPIIFTSESVRGIIEERKRQTRRVVRPQPPEDIGRIFGPETYEPVAIDRYGEMGQGRRRES